MTKTTLAAICAETFSGGTPASGRGEFWGGSIPWITSADLESFTLDGASKRVTQAGLDNSTARIAPSGALLVGTRVGVGKAAATLIDIAINQDVTACLLKRDTADPVFVALQLRAPALASIISSMKRGATIKGIPREDLLSLEIDLPALPVQLRVRRTMEALRSELMLERERATTANDLLDALMGHLFHLEFAGDNSERHYAAAKWPLVELGGIARIGNGSTPLRSNADYWRDGHIPWLNSGMIHDTFIDHAEQFVTDRAARECHLPLVPSGSVLVAITGQGKTLGNVALLEIAATVNQHLAYITPGDDLDASYLLFFLRTQYKTFRGMAAGGGTTKGALTCGALKRFKIPMPPIEEQRRIASVLTSAFEGYAASVERQRCLEELFQATLASIFERGHLQSL